MRRKIKLKVGDLVLARHDHEPARWHSASFGPSWFRVTEGSIGIVARRVTYDRTTHFSVLWTHNGRLEETAPQYSNVKSMIEVL